MGHDHRIINPLIGWEINDNSTLLYTRSSKIRLIMSKKEWESNMESYMLKTGEELVTI